MPTKCKYIHPFSFIEKKYPMNIIGEVYEQHINSTIFHWIMLKVGRSIIWCIF